MYLISPQPPPPSDISTHSIFFVLSILMEVALARHHNKEKRFGPSPANNYTSGYGKRPGFFGRLFGRKTAAAAANDDNELPEHTHPDQLNDTTRPSHGTERTAVSSYPDDTHNKYDGNGYSYPDGRQDGYGQIHYPDHEYGVTQQQQQQPSTHNPNYRYDDGVYDRA